MPSTLNALDTQLVNYQILHFLIIRSLVPRSEWGLFDKPDSCRPMLYKCMTNGYNSGAGERQLAGTANVVREAEQKGS